MADLNKKVSDALRNSEIWHQKEPTWIEDSIYDFPHEVYRVGKADQLWYYSNKWEDDDDWHTYYHDFDSHPAVYCAPDSFMWKHVKDKSPPVRLSKSLLGVASVNATIPLTYLADTLEITVDFSTGRTAYKKRFKFQKNIPDLALSKDRKTLVLLCADSPIFVRGGQMVATKHGIVK